MRTRVAVVGAQGRMGRHACDWIDDAVDLELVAKLGRHDTRDDLASLAGKVDVVVELTRPDASEALVGACVQLGLAVVTGTSGWTPERVDALRRSTASHSGRSVLIIPNFSIGAVLLARFASQAAAFFRSVEIIETHHASKVDAPSGAAIWLAGEVARGRTAAYGTAASPSGGGLCISGVPVHSLRMVGSLAEHEIRLGDAYESLSMVHTSTDRRSFAAGLLAAVRAAREMTGVHMGLENLLEQVRPDLAD